MFTVSRMGVGVMMMMVMVIVAVMVVGTFRFARRQL